MRRGSGGWGTCDGYVERRLTRRSGDSSKNLPENPAARLRIMQINAPTRPDDSEHGLNIAELLSDPADQPDEEAEKNILSAQLRDIMDAALTDRERTLIRQRYGMDGGAGYSFSQVGAGMGISRQRAHQIEAGAIEKLRQLDDIERLRDQGVP